MKKQLSSTKKLDKSILSDKHNDKKKKQDSIKDLDKWDEDEVDKTFPASDAIAKY